MSELAFNLNGEPFEFPPNAAGLRASTLARSDPGLLVKSGPDRPGRSSG
jgi:hypothetical protein